VCVSFTEVPSHSQTFNMTLSMSCEGDDEVSNNSNCSQQPHNWLQRKKAQKSRSSSQTSASCERQKLADELDKWYAEPCESEDINPFNWWASNQTRFPSIAMVARQYLAIPATSVASERLFSKCGLICSNRRAALSPQHMEHLVFLSHNLQKSTR